jgi:hypothetical protein
MVNWERVECTGEVPPAIFGHSLCQISKTKMLLFGGAKAVDGKYTMTNTAYIYNIFKRTWTLMAGNFSSHASRIE